MAGLDKIADRRSWVALLLFTGIAAALIWRWHKLGWVFGALVLLLGLRAMLQVLAARESMTDPEEELQEAKVAALKKAAER